MKILIVGSGGREHALAWKCAQSTQVTEVLVAPGNAGTASEPSIRNVKVGAEDIDGLLQLAQAQAVDLTIVGPEAPLVAGIVDRFSQSGLKCFGPSAAAAQLEGSKAFAKDFMQRHGIPTAHYGVFSDIAKARAFVTEHGAPIVIKADGLAAGKGVIVAQSESEAFAAIDDMLAGNRFGEAGHRVVVEQFLAGEEASFIVIADGNKCLPLASSQDHKARDEGDAGPNTGGMGAYSPAPVVDSAMKQAILDTIIQPTIDGMRQDGTPFTGFLYAGVMIGDDGQPRVLEFNVRFGDPETQPILMRMQSDLVQHCLDAVAGQVDPDAGQWSDQACLGVVLAAGGYPDSYGKGFPISGLDAPVDGKVFHAGTAIENDQIVTSGGRVLCCCASGDSVTDAQSRAYTLVDQISWEGVYCRRDIGYRAVHRETDATRAK